MSAGPLLERALHAASIMLALALAVAALKGWQRRKAGRARPLLALERGKPSIVYFHSPSCGVCRTGQRPILDRLLARLGPDRLQVFAVDVNEQEAIAREWGVTTLPSTYVVDPAGRVAFVNNGLAGEPALARQLSRWRESNPQ